MPCRDYGAPSAMVFEREIEDWRNRNDQLARIACELYTELSFAIAEANNTADQAQIDEMLRAKLSGETYKWMMQHRAADAREAAEIAKLQDEHEVRLNEWRMALREFESIKESTREKLNLTPPPRPSMDNRLKAHKLAEVRRASKFVEGQKVRWIEKDKVGTIRSFRINGQVRVKFSSSMPGLNLNQDQIEEFHE